MPGLIALKSAIVTLLSVVLGERLILWTMMCLGKIIVKKTSTPHDDEWLAKVEKQLKDTGKL